MRDASSRLHERPASISCETVGGSSVRSVISDAHVAGENELHLFHAWGRGGWQALTPKEGGVIPWDDASFFILLCPFPCWFPPEIDGRYGQWYNFPYR